MVNKKISELDPADPITGTETIPLVQDGETRAATVGQLLALAPPPVLLTQAAYDALPAPDPTVLYLITE